MLNIRSMCLTSEHSWTYLDRITDSYNWLQTLLPPCLQLKNMLHERKSSVHGMLDSPLKINKKALQIQELNTQAT